LSLPYFHILKKLVHFCPFHILILFHPFHICINFFIHSLIYVHQVVRVLNPIHPLFGWAKLLAP
jgi:hypothetical protein